jgi:CheY-like chemotaxis protein
MPPVKAVSVATPELKAFAGKRALVVEDDARNLYAVTALLERYGMTVVPASNAREALAKLREHRNFDVILMDIMMPETDGYQATREIRAIKEFAQIPIIALTAKASDSDRTQAMAAGCTDFVVKPAETRQLLSVLAHHLRIGATHGAG